MKKIIVFFITMFLFTISVNATKLSVKLDSCVDGDTAKFTYKGEIVTARFLAIDTPETKHPTKGVEPFGKEASDYTCKRLKEAKKIVIETDSKSTEKDKYDRYLGWIWVDDSLIQKELVSKGLAKVAYLYDDYKYADELKLVQENAQIKKVGIWGDDIPKVTKEEKKSNNKYEELITSIIYKDNKLNYPVIIIIVVAVILILVFSKSARKLVFKELEKEVKKQIKN